MSLSDDEQMRKQTLSIVHERLYHYWLRFGCSSDEAADLAQQGVMQGLQKIDHWRKKAQLTTFLITVGRNAGFDYLRREARQLRLKQKVTQVLEQVGLLRSRDNTKSDDLVRAKHA